MGAGRKADRQPDWSHNCLSEQWRCGVLPRSKYGDLMSGKMCSDEEFSRLFQTVGPTQTAKVIGCSERAVYKRRANMARFESIPAPGKQPNAPGRVHVELKNG